MSWTVFLEVLTEHGTKTVENMSFPKSIPYRKLEFTTKSVKISILVQYRYFVWYGTALTPGKIKKQERGSYLKLKKLSENSIKPQPQIAPTNSDCVSKNSSISNPISDLVSKSNINSFQSSHSNSLSNTKSTVDVPPISPPTTVVESNSSVTIRCLSSSTSTCLSRRPPNAPVSITIPKVHSANLSNIFLRPCYATSNVKYHTLPQFLTARRPLLPRLFVQPTIQLPKWSTQKSQLYNLFSENSFTSNGCVINKDVKYLVSISTPNSINDYFHSCLFSCLFKFCNENLKCCFSCGLPTHQLCLELCSDCSSSSTTTPHCFGNCPKFLLWLHTPNSSHHSTWINIVKKQLCLMDEPNFPPQPFPS